MNSNINFEQLLIINDLNILCEYLNHPWFIYPHAFMSEYNNYQLYKRESIRLEFFLNNFKNNLESNNYGDSKILLPIIIGSTMEDAFLGSHSDITKYSFQFEQLFPNYINNFIDKSDGHKYIEIIIISPDRIFSNDEYIPLFAKLSRYDFNKINNYKYTSTSDSYVININIFNCPMVTIEKRINTIKKCDIILSECKKNIDFDCQISTYKQTKFDLFLINKIYEHIEKIFSYVHNDNPINIIVNSWVSFKNLYGYSENYNMFPELLKLASDYNIIATDWDYQDENFISTIKSNYHFGNKSFKFNKIVYISYDNYFIDNEIINKNLTNLKYNLHNLYQIDFSEKFNLDIITL